MSSGCLLHSGLNKNLFTRNVKAFYHGLPYLPFAASLTAPLTTASVAAKSPFPPFTFRIYCLHTSFCQHFPDISYRNANRFFMRKACHSPVNLVHLKFSSWRVGILISILKGLRCPTLKKPGHFFFLELSQTHSTIESLISDHLLTSPGK